MDTLHEVIGRDGSNLRWWQMCVRAVLVFAFGLIAIRLAGKRVRGRWGAMDIVLFVMIGSNLSRTLTANAPLFPTLAATGVLVALHALLSRAAVGFPAVGPLLKGRSCRLVSNGRADEEALRRHGVGQGDLDEALRTAGHTSLSDVEEVWIERNGDISVIARSPAAGGAR